MTQQIFLSPDAKAADPVLDAARNDGTHEVADGVAYRRLGIVNVVFIGQRNAGDRGWWLVDAGLAGTKGLIVAAAAARFGRNARPAAILMTHGHFDHIGTLVDLASEWDAPVIAHRLEHPYLDGSASYPPGDPSVGGGAMAALSGFYPRGPVDVGDRLQALPEDGSIPGLAGWRWLHTPGHSVGHVSFWREADRVLVAGDAFVTTRQESAYAVAVEAPEMHGPPMYYTVEWDKAKRSVDLLAALEPEIAVTGHGAAMQGPEMRDALRKLAGAFDDVAVPRHGLYVDTPARAEDGSAYVRPNGAPTKSVADAERPHGAEPYVRYRDDVEKVAPDEAETVRKILESMERLGARMHAATGHALRVSHAKIHGAAVGTLEVLGDLPAPFAQGLFARPGRYDVIVRMANVPGEIVPDRVSTQRGLALKILGVKGEMLSGHDGGSTQDFVLDTTDRFAAPDAKAFLATHLALEHAPSAPSALKEAASALSFVANKALHAVGADSANLDFFGHPHLHPLAEAYFSQAPLRHGDFIGKVKVQPVSPALVGMQFKGIDVSQDEDALRTATVDYLATQPAEFDVCIQLCTDFGRMPVEDASAAWDEAESPYVPVARLMLPAQDAYSPGRRAFVDERLSFCVSHSLAAHRPLGSIMRARMQAYPRMAARRFEVSGYQPTEPLSVRDVPN